MAMTLFQSDMNSTDIIRMEEKDFDNSVFSGDTEARYAHGLYDFSVVMDRPDTLSKDIRGKSKLPPVSKQFDPDKPKSREAVSPGLFCERLPLVLDKGNGDMSTLVFPLGSDNIFRFDRGTYVSTPMDRCTNKFSNYNNDYTQKTGDRYSCDCVSSVLGSSSTGHNRTTNLIRYKDGSGDWRDCFKYPDTVSKVTGGSSFFASDLIRVTANKIDEYSVRVPSVFTRNVAIGSTGTYCFSFFARHYDTNYTDDGIETIDYRNSENRNTYGEISVSLSQGSTQITPSGVIHKDIPVNEGVYRVNGRWKRLSFIFDVGPSNADITVSIEVKYGFIVDICGLLLEKANQPSPYDSRLVTYDASVRETITYPLTIYTGVVSGKTATGSWRSMPSSWTINYKRFCEALPDGSGGEFKDRIGPFEFGYEGQTAVLRRDGETDPVAIESGAFSSYGNSLEDVFVTYDGLSSPRSFVVKVMNMNGSYSLTYTLPARSRRTGLFDPEHITGTDEGLYNLLLGCSRPDPSREGIVLHDGYYRDVVCYPVALTDDEISLLHKTYFSVGVVSDASYDRTSVMDPRALETPATEITWAELLALHDIAEGKAYKLTTGSTDGEYDVGDYMVCYKEIPETPIEEADVGKHWTRTYLVTETKDLIARTLMKSALMMEGFERIYERQ